ncbi:cytochrome B [Rhodobacter capsulatus]|uniref:Cytochrome B n=2 Tax=Rhodobacter capsulatus TaxID=1061 RepID=A0A4U1JS96_RHOCA|nr:cytochrome B [Rhodobacter capsulatus]
MARGRRKVVDPTQETTMIDPSQTVPAAYSRLQKRLHWAVLLLVAAQFTVFHEIGRAFGHAMHGGRGTDGGTVALHALTGLTILGLMLWRLAIARRDGVPALPEAEPDWAARLARVTHAAFYAVLIAMPVLGGLALFAHIGPAAGLHKLLAGGLLGLIALHVTAVAVHQLAWKTNILGRMA